MHYMAVKFLSLARAALTTTAPAWNGRIDTHIHAVPQIYLDAIERAGGDPSGFPVPTWSIDETLLSMDKVRSSIGILSITTPGAPIAGTGTEGRELARGLNEYLGNETVGSSRLGFFGALPDWRDVNGTLDEIDYLYQTQRLCNGVGFFSSYGNLLPGDPLFAPIWNRLNSYNALVFLHPTTLPGVEPAFIAGGLPQPIIDFPLATTRAAVDLVFTGTVTANPNLDIILSHAGGALPFLVNRAVGSLLVPEVAAVANVTVIQARRAFQRFYYDIALSTSAAQLDGLLDFTDASKILWGSDYPYAPEPAIDGLVLQYTAYVGTNRRGSYIAPHVLRKNAARLLQKQTLDKTFDFDKIQPAALFWSVALMHAWNTTDPPVAGYGVHTGRVTRPLPAECSQWIGPEHWRQSPVSYVNNLSAISAFAYA